MAEPFLPFSTDRLTIRAFHPDDADILAAYRNDADVARYQDWAMPVPLERVRATIERAQEVGDRPVAGDGWQLAVDLDGSLIGDVYLGLDDLGAVATIGYTFAPAHQGRGYALEAVGAVIDRLLALRPGVHRLSASLDPQNTPSVRLLESLGFTAEGVARRSEHIRDQWVDDGRYGMLREDRAAWLARPVAPPTDVRLVQVTSANVRDVGRLATFDWQQRLVAPNLVSLAEALVPGTDDDGGRLVPWYRAVEADGELVGFVMMAEPTTTLPDAFLWRLMIDRRHQRRGIGQRVLDLVVRQAGEWRAAGLLVGWEPGLGSAAPFYLRNGFVPTGEVEDGEIFARLTLVSTSPASP